MFTYHLAHARSWSFQKGWSRCFRFRIVFPVPFKTHLKHYISNVFVLNSEFFSQIQKESGDGEFDCHRIHTPSWIKIYISNISSWNLKFYLLNIYLIFLSSPIRLVRLDYPPVHTPPLFLNRWRGLLRVSCLGLVSCYSSYVILASPPEQWNFIL